MPYKAITQFVAGDRQIVVGQVLDDDDPVVALDADDSDGRVPWQLLAPEGT
jgi:hypothetical protein